MGRTWQCSLQESKGKLGAWGGSVEVTGVAVEVTGVAAEGDTASCGSSTTGLRDAWVQGGVEVQREESRKIQHSIAWKQSEKVNQLQETSWMKYINWTLECWQDFLLRQQGVPPACPRQSFRVTT